MKRYTLCLIFDKDNPLYWWMAYKIKGLYPHKWNAVGGKVEANELACNGVVRELTEETGLTISDITPIQWLCTLTLPGYDNNDDVELHVYATNALKQPKQMEDEPMKWQRIGQLNDYSYAGDGNLRYFLKLAELRGFAKWTDVKNY